MRRRLAVAAVAAFALSALLAVGQPAAEAHRGGRPLQEVRHATAPYRDFTVAQAAGTVPVIDVNGISCIEDPAGSGAMGTHYLFGDRLMSGSGFDGRIVATEPEILLYDTTTSSPQLMGVEYVVVADAWHAEHGKKAPKLFGRRFELVPAGNRYGLPAFYELHLWLWKHNPNGLFADYNPRVTC